MKKLLNDNPKSIMLVLFIAAVGFAIWAVMLRRQWKNHTCAAMVSATGADATETPSGV